MPNETRSTPRQYPGIMLSSRSRGLERHRAALVRAIERHPFRVVAMEYDSAKADIDVIESSLEMVRDASAYIGIIGFSYGQIPLCPRRNPDALSLTELEFNEAQRLKRPILLFIMGETHPVRPADSETSAANKQKLDTFRERAKRMNPGSPVHRVYATFDSLGEFTSQVAVSVANLRRHLDARSAAATEGHGAQLDVIPTPPAFYAEPPYIGSNEFVGRRAQLDGLNDWAVPADPHPVLLFDAIGGSGKSMLTWEWTTKHAATVRGDWEGRFWYSFYERGAIMADFCRRALAYITGTTPEAFREKKIPELGELLLHHLQSGPWLLILDGLERVLVAYHRFDAAQVPDEDANKPTDQIADRDPCAAVRPEDDDLLRAFAAAAPSKLLITTRLIPRVLLNPATQPIPGVLRVTLPGLRPEDAEALLRACGVTGDSRAIQSFLKSHCDCHPLVTGVLAGLVTDYLPDKGNFDAWAADPAGGGQLNLANLDLVQKRNHILKAALAALPEKGRQLLSILALLSEAVDSTTLSALNPHLPPDTAHQTTSGSRDDGTAITIRRQSPEAIEARRELAKTVRDLERRSLLQYDNQTRRYDLHPVVRGVAAGTLGPEETDRYGQRVVDHFSRQAHRPYQNAEALEDLQDGLHVLRTLLKMGRYQPAVSIYRGPLARALLFYLEAYEEVLSLLRPFFPEGWATPLNAVDEASRAYLANDAGLALNRIGQPREALCAFGASLNASIGRWRQPRWEYVRVAMTNVSVALAARGRLAGWERHVLLGIDLATLIDDDQEELFRAWLDRFRQIIEIGQWPYAELLWQKLDQMGRKWSRASYRPGDAEFYYAQFRFWKGDLAEEHLARAEQLAARGNNRFAIRGLHSLRGQWYLEQGQWLAASESLHEAVRMARAVAATDQSAETQLALAKVLLGQLADPRREAGRLTGTEQQAHRPLADLWFAIGDREQARRHALLAYRWAWADGEPYVHRFELSKARTLLEKLGLEVPKLPSYDPRTDERFPWEDRLTAAIEKHREEKARVGR